VRRAAQDSKEHGAQFVLVSGVSQLLADATSDGITVIDQGPAMDNPAFPLPGELRHYTPDGHGALAWEIARSLTEHHLVPQDHLRPGLAQLVGAPAAPAAPTPPTPPPASAPVMPEGLRPSPQRP
jgi:hypothetical protein